MSDLLFIGHWCLIQDIVESIYLHNFEWYYYLYIGWKQKKQSSIIVPVNPNLSEVLDDNAQFHDV